MENKDTNSGENQSSLSKEVYNEAIELVNDDKVFRCSLCEYETRNKFNLQEHIDSLHEGIKYPCAFCGHMSSTSNNLKKHVARVHSECYS